MSAVQRSGVALMTIEEIKSLEFVHASRAYLKVKWWIKNCWYCFKSAVSTSTVEAEWYLGLLSAPDDKISGVNVTRHILTVQMRTAHRTVNGERAK